METKTKWVIDPQHSEINFKVKHLMITNVKGEFKNFSGDVLTSGDDFDNASITVHIDASSIFTNSDDRDTHLKGSDFFDVENFKEITFVSKSFKKISDDEYKLVGDLTIKDVTNEISFDVEFGGINSDPWGNVKAGFSMEQKINRKDWGLTYNAVLETGGVLVGEEVKINIEVELLKQS